MSKLFINLSYHRSSKWGADQLSAAQQLGIVIDLPFPSVEPSSSKRDITDLANKLYSQIMDIRLSQEGIVRNPEVYVYLMGEISLVFCLGSYLLDRGYKVVCSTTERFSVETQLPDGTTKKENVFRFVQFREFVKPG